MNLTSLFGPSFFGTASHIFSMLVMMLGIFAVVPMFIDKTKGMTKQVKHKVARRIAVASLISIIIGVIAGPYILKMAQLPTDALGAVGGVAFTVEGFLMFRARYVPAPEPEPEPELTRRERVMAFAFGKLNTLADQVKPFTSALPESVTSSSWFKRTFYNGTAAEAEPNDTEAQPAPGWKLKFLGGNKVVEQVSPAPTKRGWRKAEPTPQQPVREPSKQELAELLTWAAVPMAFPFIGGAGVNSALIAARESYTSTVQTVGMCLGVLGALAVLWISLRFLAKPLARLKASTLFIINKVNGALLLAIGLYLFANCFTAMVVRSAVLTLRQMGIIAA